MELIQAGSSTLPALNVTVLGRHDNWAVPPTHVSASTGLTQIKSSASLSEGLVSLYLQDNQLS